MSEETSLHLYYSIISLASLIEFSGEVILLYNYTVFRYARYGIIPIYPLIYSVKEKMVGTRFGIRDRYPRRTLGREWCLGLRHGAWDGAHEPVVLKSDPWRGFVIISAIMSSVGQ
jgi:hypothetical protein